MPFFGIGGSSSIMGVLMLDGCATPMGVPQGFGGDRSQRTVCALLHTQRSLQLVWKASSQQRRVRRWPASSVVVLRLAQAPRSQCHPLSCLERRYNRSCRRLRRFFALSKRRSVFCRQAPWSRARGDVFILFVGRPFAHGVFRLRGLMPEPLEI